VKTALITLLLFFSSCTVDHDIPPIKVEKIEIEHKISPIIIKLPWAEFFKANPNCSYIDQIAKADLSDFCLQSQKYLYNCCEIDFDMGKNGCIVELCVKKYYPDQGCVRIVKGCI
jgi:hypothetical protein